jgi:hypothetical protein
MPFGPLEAVHGRYGQIPAASANREFRPDPRPAANAVGRRGDSGARKAIPLQNDPRCTRVVPCFTQRGNVEKALLKAARRIDD